MAKNCAHASVRVHDLCLFNVIVLIRPRIPMNSLVTNPRQLLIYVLSMVEGNRAWRLQYDANMYVSSSFPFSKNLLKSVVLSGANVAECWLSRLGLDTQLVG